MPNLTSAENEIFKNITVKNNYYQYSIITPNPTNLTNKETYQIVYVTDKKMNFTNITNIHDKKVDIEIHTLNPNISHIQMTNNKIKENMPIKKVVHNYNDLKFKKWSRVKLLRNSRLFSKLSKLNRTLSFLQANITRNNTVTSQNQTKNVEMIEAPKVKNYNKNKILNIIKNKQVNLNQRTTLKDRIYHKIDNLQNILKRMLHELRNNNTTKVKPKRFNVIKYLKRFFRKMFKKRNNKGVITINNKAILNKHIIDTICSSFNNCDKAQRNSPILTEKIKELYSESFTILRAINVIKGLLHLLNLPDDKAIDDTTHLKHGEAKSNFKDDVRKLNAILNDHYASSDYVPTDTEKTQITYIKKNTKLFIQSVGKFATKLNEIIYILTKKSSDKIVKKLNTRDVKKQDKNAMNTKIVSEGLLKKLKDALQKYNVMKLALEQSMHETLTMYRRLPDRESKEKMLYNYRNATVTIAQFSDNIIRNLKKIRQMAEVLNSGHRKKRDALRDDDAMEYLLTLMEYLLKQNYPLDAAPGKFY